MIFKNVNFYTFKPLRDKSIRLSLDTQELNKEDMGELSELYKKGEVSLIISDNPEMIECIEKLMNIIENNPSILEKLY
jgi:hypothetical protein